MFAGVLSTRCHGSTKGRPRLGTRYCINFPFNLSPRACARQGRSLEQLPTEPPSFATATQRSQTRPHLGNGFQSDIYSARNDDRTVCALVRKTKYVHCQCNKKKKKHRRISLQSLCTLMSTTPGREPIRCSMDWTQEPQVIPSTPRETEHRLPFCAMLASSSGGGGEQNTKQNRNDGTHLLSAHGAALL